MTTRRALILFAVFVVAVLGGAVAGMAVLESDAATTPRSAFAADGMVEPALNRGSSGADEGLAPAESPGGHAAPTGDDGAGSTAPTAPDPVGPDPVPAPDPTPAPPDVPLIEVKYIQALLAPSITASVTPSSGEVWHNGASGLCLDPGSGATYLTVDAHVHVGPGRSIASVTAEYAAFDVSDVTSWVAADGGLFYTVAFNGYQAGAYTMTLTLVDNTGASDQFTKPFVVHDCANPG